MSHTDFPITAASARGNALPRGNDEPLVGDHRPQAKLAGEALDNACGSIVRAVERA